MTFRSGDFKSPRLAPQAFDNSQVTQTASDLSAPGAARHRPEAQTPHSVEAQTPPDLDRVVAAWPGLPEHIKAAVLALVKTTEV